jgi:2,4-dienoyl-CoA reductase-like NADH-dependent reductase (Old Yellow Enzyme family)
MLFEPISLGELRVKNRFVNAATYEAMATEAGEVTDGLVERYRRLARGDVGLIITGHVYVHPLGRGARYQLGIHTDDMIPGLGRLAQAVHREGGKIVLVLAHAGRQTTSALIGETPQGPSSRGRDPVNFVRPRVMSEGQIHEAIRAFGKAAERAAEARVDGVEIYAATRHHAAPGRHLRAVAGRVGDRGAGGELWLDDLRPLRYVSRGRTGRQAGAKPPLVAEACRETDDKPLGWDV